MATTRGGKGRARLSTGEKNGTGGLSSGEKDGVCSSRKKMKLACLEDCLPGKKHGCANRSYKKACHGKNKSCHEVNRIIQALGVDPESASKCIKAAIMRGHIAVKGEKGELDMVVLEGKNNRGCGHMMKAKLGDLLKQPDYAGLDYADGLQSATVVCTQCGPEDIESGLGRAYVTALCIGDGRFDDGKAHNHCYHCPGFGKCIYDYRMCHNSCCGDHIFVGRFGHEKGDPKCTNRRCFVFKKWQAKGLMRDFPDIIKEFVGENMSEEAIKASTRKAVKKAIGISPPPSDESSSDDCYCL